MKKKILVKFLLLVFLILSIYSAKYSPEDTIIGIDLGTTYSCVGVLKNGVVEIIPNEQGNRVTPSYVSFTQDGERLIGDFAKSQLSLNPSNTLFDSKRFIGRDWNDPFVQANRGLYPFRISESPNGKVFFEVATKSLRRSFTPKEVSAMVLSKMKYIAEVYLGHPVYHAVITVPAYFNDAQRSATRDAAIIAGLNVSRLINEPTSAAMAFGYGIKDESENEKAVEDNQGLGIIGKFFSYFHTYKVKDNAKNVIVYDLGGGTFDVSVLTLDDGIFEVLSTTGNSALGGQDFDQNLMNYILGNYIKRTGNRDVMSDSKAIQKLRREVERAKRTLSSYPDSIIEVEDFYSGHDLKEKITRTEFEKINNKLFDSTLDKIKEVLKDAKLRAKEIDDVLLVGGSTRIPYIRELIKNYFSGRSPRIDVHPDEAVAFGAAIQGGILQKHESFKDVILLDINSLTLGIEASTGLMSVLLKRGSRIPGKKSAIHSTAKDNQENVDIKVYEGERPVAKDNHLLGSFVLDEIPPAPRGVPQIEVTFEIDANGILEVTAKDLLTRKSESRIIANSKNRMQSEDIQRMIQVAIKFKKQDDKQRERIKAHSDLEAMVYSFKKLLASNEEIKMKLSKEKFEALQKSVEDIITWLEKDSTKDADRYEFVQVRTRLEKNIQMFADEWKLRELQIWIQETQSKINNSTGNRSGHDEL